MDNKVLNIENLSIWYKTYRGHAKVVDDISLYVNQGEKVGLVGESGCGKTTTVKTALQIIEASSITIPSGGEIEFNGQDVLTMDMKSLMALRHSGAAMISQSPMSALNPVFTIGEQMLDIIKYSGQYGKASKQERVQLVKDAITSVLLSDPERIMESYPHQLSGGMRQRICIASALLTPRDLLIADEPCTALDVTVQDQIHSMLRELVEEKNRSLIMITHSLGVARELVDRIYIMYGGTIVETCRIEDLFSDARHPYTVGLMACVPRLSGGGLSTGIYGYVPDYVNPPAGCRFYPRCQEALPLCAKCRPPRVEISPGHEVACFRCMSQDARDAIEQGGKGS